MRLREESSLKVDLVSVFPIYGRDLGKLIKLRIGTPDDFANEVRIPILG